ncbi:MAG: hypothetical protein AB1390_00475 [Nitrospirota bacterium]
MGGISIDIKDEIVSIVCLACPFHEKDCDFMERKEKSLPCGGFIALSLLLEKGYVTVDNIKDII